MSLDVAGIGAVADLATTVVNKIWPDKSEQERQQLASALAIVQGQLDANKVEAASPSVWTSGWRPGVGWICVAALAMQYVARPLISWIAAVSGHPLPVLPGIDDNLWQLLVGLLGLGGLRTFEKVSGVAK